jgi:hypothetical protein
MKKPALRVTKWLGDIPVEAECTSCLGESKFRAASTHYRPDKADYQEKLQRAFDRHFQDVHAGGDADQSASQIVRQAKQR